MKSYRDLMEGFPLAMTAKEADEKRTELVTWLRTFADAVEDGSFKFDEGLKFHVGVVRDD